MTRARASLVLNACLFVVFCGLNEVPLTGLRVHEWIGFAFAWAVLTHLLLSWNWIVSATRNLLKSASARNVVNYGLNFSLFAVMIILILSGVMISRHALPTLGAQIDENVRWVRLHSAATNFAIGLTGFHVAMNWDSIYAMLRVRKA
jgi:hypothetical protein